MVRDLQDMRQTINDKLKSRGNNTELFDGMEM